MGQKAAKGGYSAVTAPPRKPAMTTSTAMHNKLRWTAAALALLLAACAAPPSEPTPLRLGIQVWPGYFPAILAEQQGLMAEHGVALDWMPVDDTKTLIAGFAAGRYDLITVSLGDAIVLRRSRPDVLLLLLANESSGGDQLLRAPGLAADAPGPWRYGTSLGGFGELFIQAWLNQQGIDPRQVIWADINAAEMPAALREGRVDYGHTWQPFVNQAVADGATPVFTSAQTPGLIVDVVLTSRAVQERHPEALRGFAQAWFIAAERWRAEPDAGKAAVAKALDLDPADISLAGIQLFRLADNHRLMAGGDNAELAALIRRYRDFFVEHRGFHTPLVATTMFDARLLPASTAPP